MTFNLAKPLSIKIHLGRFFFIVIKYNIMRMVSWPTNNKNSINFNYN